MLYSMTGFAREEMKAPWGTAIWEMRSVNQRYLETSFRLPESFRQLENVLREKLRNSLSRGKVECFLRVELAPVADATLNINYPLATQILNAMNELKNIAGGEVQLMDVLRYPGVVTPAEQDLDAIAQALLVGFDTALAAFIQSRAREGEKLSDVIEQRLQGIETEIAHVQNAMPDVLNWQRQRLQQRFEEAQVEADPQRFEQEMVMLAQRLDVAEELDRLQLHVKEIRHILHKGGAVGRKLDFMMQELNREANTLASKSINASVTASAVELKVLIEQMREQIQNLE